MLLNHCYTDTLLHWILLHGYSVHYYFLFMSHWHTDTLIHGIPSLHILLSSLHGCSVHSYIMFTYHCYTCMSYFYILVIWITVHIACIFSIPVAWLFFVTDIPVTGYVSYWYVMCETKCHVDQATRATSWIPYLLFPISRYLVICYQLSSGPVIMLHVPCTILVFTMQCTLNIMNITWG